MVCTQVSDTDENLTVLSELEGVCDQIRQNLLGRVIGFISGTRGRPRSLQYPSSQALSETLGLTNMELGQSSAAD
jgi:hypothetical protein